jgi:hypothetical protein
MVLRRASGSEVRQFDAPASGQAFDSVASS